MLRFRYERLRGFCEACGMLTHDSSNCLIENGGGNHSESDGSDDDNQHQSGNNNQRVQIQELVATEQVDPEHNEEAMNLIMFRTRMQ